MHRSTFSYNLSRPYPFRWFTPSVIIGGILATIAISVLSVHTSGYQNVSESAADPNATEARKTWFSHGLSSALGGLQPSCLSTTIPLNTVLYTNNSAIQYTLTNVSTTSAGGRPLHEGSLIYHNNPLQNCSISGLDIEFENMQRSAAAIAMQQQGVETFVYISCSIETTSGITTLNLTAKYDYSPDGASETVTPAFLGRNKTAQPSHYLGESILHMYWVQLSNAVYTSNQHENYQYYKGMVKLARDPSRPMNSTNLKSLEFFSNVGCFFLKFSATGVENPVSYCTGSNVSDLAHSSGSGLKPMPDIWRPVDGLGKALYSTIFTDLGQTGTSDGNILTSVDLLQYMTANFTNMTDAVINNKPWGQNVLIDPNLATMPFTERNITDYDLRINPSTLATSYICQVPQLKPSGPLVVSVLVADLVLLQAVWRIYKFIVNYLMSKRHPELQHCEGCAGSDRASLIAKEEAMTKDDGYVRVTDGGLSEKEPFVQARLSVL